MSLLGKGFCETTGGHHTPCSADELASALGVPNPVERAAHAVTLLDQLGGNAEMADDGESCRFMIADGSGAGPA